MGAGNHPRTRKGQERGPSNGGKGHHGKRHDPHPGRATTTGGPAPPHPHGTPHDSRGRTPQHAPPKQASDARGITPAHTHQPSETTRGMEGTPTRGERATPTEEAAGNAAAWRTTTPSPPGDDPSRHKAHLTGTGRGRRHGHSNQGQGPGPPQDTGPRHRPPGRATPRTPTRPTSPSRTPRPPQHGPSKTHTPNRTPQPPASHTLARTSHHNTGQAELH